MVRTDNLWRYTRTIELQHDCSEKNPGDSWSTLVKVTDSEAQGWDLHLECGCKLQSCFGETEWEVQMILSDEVANWPKI
jgi:hypothetical protein